MNYQQLQRQIDLQNEWADELAKQPQLDNSEPIDSLRNLFLSDDHPNHPKDLQCTTIV